MEVYESYTEAFRSFAEEALGVKVTSWDAQRPTMGVEGEFEFAGLLDRWGEASTIFEDLTAVPSIYSIGHSERETEGEFAAGHDMGPGEGHLGHTPSALVDVWIAELFLASLGVCLRGIPGGSRRKNAVRQ